ncbi:MAG: ATP-binding protein [Candidatus Buchananbacteria bacterium]|nr:ATP-binding protein [Candidatus Buchananbacteria bacterium]
MKKVVLTGGPCAGKTTILEAIQKNFSSKIAVVPEAATLLLSGGFPAPGKQLKFSADWQDAFQAAIIEVQRSLERSYQLIAEEKGIELLICDRGILDGIAYTSGGESEFVEKFKVDVESTLKGYEAVIHLESLATAKPHLYGQGHNEHRLEGLEEAKELEGKTRQAWSSHRQHVVIENKGELEDTLLKVTKIIESIINS